MSNFKVGDIVTLKRDCSGALAGRRYTLKQGDANGGQLHQLWAWDEGTKRNGGGGCYCQGNWSKVEANPSVAFADLYWNQPEWNHFFNSSIVLTTSKPTNLIKKTMNYIKNALLSKEDKKLIEAGFMNESLELTPEGLKALTFILFMDHKAKLVTMAEEAIAEKVTK
jgi:hypothetical protein